MPDRHFCKLGLHHFFHILDSVILANKKRWASSQQAPIAGFQNPDEVPHVAFHRGDVWVLTTVQDFHIAVGTIEFLLQPLLRYLLIK